METITADQMAAKGQQMAQIAGRGLFYGAAGSGGRKRIFSEADWTAACKQAQAWGLQCVHPKVADGGYWWYDQSGLSMLKRVADAYHLTCYPYHYCYGNKFGALAVEASYTIAIGKLFGGVCPDMEIEFEQSSQGAAWAKEYGQRVRAQWSGPVLPTLFANPEQHARFPYKELLSWVSGWMPMAYFDLWTNAVGHMMSAKEAVLFLYPQWVALNKQLVSAGIFPPPILPLIEIGNHLPVTEVASWLVQMKSYGYCGFWYDGLYSPYATAVAAAPQPAWTAAPPTQTTEAPMTNNVTLVAGIQQSLTDEELEATWALLDPTIPYVPAHGIPALWIRLILAGYAIGSPLSREQKTVYKGVTYTYQNFEGGRIWFNGQTGHVWPQFASQARIPGTSKE